MPEFVLPIPHDTAMCPSEQPWRKRFETMTSCLFTIAARNGTVNGEVAGRGSWRTVAHRPYRGVWNGSWGAAPCWTRLVQTRFEFYARAGQRGACSSKQPQRTRSTGPWRWPSRSLLHTDARVEQRTYCSGFHAALLMTRKTLPQMTSSDACAISRLVERTPRYVSRLI